MANTYVDYTGDNSETDFIFNFDYLQNDHVKVKVNDVIVTNYSIVEVSADNVIRFNTAPASNASIRIYRDSRGDFSPLVGFVDGSVLTGDNLDEAYKHNLFVSQEASEGTGNELLNKKGGANYDAEGNKIINLGTPTTSTDAANKGYVDQTIDNSIALGGSPAIVSLGGYDVTALGTSITKSLANWTNDLNSPTATGSSEPRSLADRFADYINVLDYGAYNDGSNPSVNVTAIQAAIDALHSGYSEGTQFKGLYFPSGTYKMDGAVTIPLSATYASFVGASDGSTVILSLCERVEDGSLFNVHCESSNWRGFRFEATNNAPIFKCLRNGDTGGEGNSADIDITITDCTFENVETGIELTGRGARIYNCGINTSATGVFLQIQAPDPFNPGGAYGQKEETGMRRYIIDGCDIDGVDRLVKIHGTNNADQYVHGLVINGCHGSGIKQLITGTSLRNSAITGNTFISSRGWTGTKGYYIHVKYLENVVISGNIIRQQYDYVNQNSTIYRVASFVGVTNNPTDLSDVEPSTNVNLKGLTIENNIISDVTSNFITCNSRASYVNVRNNTLIRFSDGGTGTPTILQAYQRINDVDLSNNDISTETSPSISPTLLSVSSSDGNSSSFKIVDNSFKEEDGASISYSNSNLSSNGFFFTPSLTIGGGTTGIAYSNQYGNWYRNGNVVTVTGIVSLSSKGSLTGNVQLTGLPFTPVAILSSSLPPSTISAESWVGIGWDTAGASNRVNKIATISTTDVRLYDEQGVVINDSIITNTFSFRFNLTYVTSEQL